MFYPIFVLLCLILLKYHQSHFCYIFKSVTHYKKGYSLEYYLNIYLCKKKEIKITWHIICYHKIWIAHIRCLIRRPWASIHKIRKEVHMARLSERGRDAKTGQFIPVKEAQRRKSTAVVEKIKVGPVKHRK